MGNVPLQLFPTLAASLVFITAGKVGGGVDPML